MTNPGEMNVVAEIKKRYGNVIDLDKSPNVILEIIHNFRYMLDENARLDPGNGGGGPTRPEDVGSATLLNLVLELKREVAALHAKIK